MAQIETDIFLQKDLITLFKNIPTDKYYTVEDKVSGRHRKGYELETAYAIDQIELIASIPDVIKLFTEFINENYQPKPL